MPEMDLLEKLLDAKFGEVRGDIAQLDAKVDRDRKETLAAIATMQVNCKTDMKAVNDRVTVNSNQLASLNGASRQRGFHWSQLGYMGSILAGLGTIAYALMR